MAVVIPMPAAARVERVAVALGQMQQTHEAGLALDECADRGLLSLPMIKPPSHCPASLRSSGGNGCWWIERIGCSNLELRRSSREIVEGARPSRRMASRTLTPERCRSAISNHSSWDRNRALI